MNIGVRIEEGFESGAIEFDVFAVGDVTDLEEGGDDVDGVTEGVDLPMLAESSSGPVDEHGDAVPPIVFRAFSALHAGVEDVGSGGSAVVGGEDEEGIFGDAEVGEELAGGSDVVIDVGDHAKKGGDAILLVLVNIQVFLRTMEGAVRGVG